MEKTIRVTGKGVLTLAPDTIRVRMSLNDIEKEYAKSIQKSQNRADAIISLFLELGFKKEDIKTTFYNIDTYYESIDTKSGWKSIFKGYEVERTMAVEFERDNELLGKIVGMLATSEAKPEFRLNFFAKDQEAIKAKLLELAVTDARKKAEILSIAAGVQLGDILDINHSWGELRFESREYPMPMVENRMSCADASPMALDIEPEDIEMNDTVTIVWKIQ